MKLSIRFLLTSLLVAILFLGFAIHRFQKQLTQQKEIPYSGAYQAIEYWSKTRQYGSKEPFQQLFARNSELAFQQKLLKRTTDTLWRPIGPRNVAGRMLSLVFNPENEQTIYSGSASGGLWRSYSAGVGIHAWHRIPIGFPVLGIATIAIHPQDSLIMYIGTGEVYGYKTTEGGEVVRETRGTYGIGALKTVDGGLTWEKTIDYSAGELTGVQKILLNPLRPETVWASTTEGLLVSYDSGTHWETKLNVIMGSDIAIHSIDTTKMLATFGNLGSDGKGVYRSIDGGSTWTIQNNPFPSNFDGKAVIHAWSANSDLVYISLGMGFTNGDQSYLYKSADFGETWNLIPSNTTYANYQGWYGHFIGINPSDSTDLLLGGVDIHRSTDEGVRFFQKTYWYKSFPDPAIGAPTGPSDFSHADHHSITYHPSNSSIIYVTNDGGVYRTLDGGESWESVSAGLQTAQFYAGVSQAKDDSVFIIGGLQDNSTVINTGNDRWRQVIGGDGSYTAVNPSNSTIVYASYYYLNVYRSSDKGIQFSALTLPLATPAAFIAPFRISPTSTNTLYAGRSTVLKSINGGASWTTTNGGIALNPFQPVHVLEVSNVSSSVVYAATAPTVSRSRVFKTLNGGNSWLDITQDLPDRYVGFIKPHPKNDSILYIGFSGFSGGHIFKSINGGTSWTDISGTLPDVPAQAFAIDPSYPNHVYLGNDIGVYRSLDAGQNWEPLQDGLTDAVLSMDLIISNSFRVIRLATYGNGMYERELPPISQESNGPEIPSNPVESFKLYQNYPNPFNPTTTIQVDLPEAGTVTIKLYNVKGAFIKTLVHTTEASSGIKRYSISSDGLASGIYFYRITTSNGESQTKKLSILK